MSVVTWTNSPKSLHALSKCSILRGFGIKGLLMRVSTLLMGRNTSFLSGIIGIGLQFYFPLECFGLVHLDLGHIPAFALNHNPLRTRTYKPCPREISRTARIIKTIPSRPQGQAAAPSVPIFSPDILNIAQRLSGSKNSPLTFCAI